MPLCDKINKYGIVFRHQTFLEIVIKELPYICILYFRVSTCSSTISNNCTYIQNPSYPSSYTTSGNCVYNISPLSSDICQIRLDFDFFDTTDAAAGACTTDYLGFTAGSSRIYPVLCGTLTGQHSKSLTSYLN